MKLKLNLKLSIFFLPGCVQQQKAWREAVGGPEAGNPAQGQRAAGGAERKGNEIRQFIF